MISIIHESYLDLVKRSQKFSHRQVRILSRRPLGKATKPISKSPREFLGVLPSTARQVLYMGGFNGGDSVIDAEGLVELVANGDLRFVLFGDSRDGKRGIARWLQTSCTVVLEFSQSNTCHAQGQQRPDSRDAKENVLYQCG